MGSTKKLKASIKSGIHVQKYLVIQRYQYGVAHIIGLLHETVVHLPASG